MADSERPEAEQADQPHNHDAPTTKGSTPPSHEDIVGSLSTHSIRDQVAEAEEQTKDTIPAAITAENDTIMRENSETEEGGTEEQDTTMGHVEEVSPTTPHEEQDRPGKADATVNNGLSGEGSPPPPNEELDRAHKLHSAAPATNTDPDADSDFDSDSDFDAEEDDAGKNFDAEWLKKLEALEPTTEDIVEADRQAEKPLTSNNTTLCGHAFRWWYDSSDRLAHEILNIPKTALLELLLENKDIAYAYDEYKRHKPSTDTSGSTRGAAFTKVLELLSEDHDRFKMGTELDIATWEEAEHLCRFMVRLERVLFIKPGAILASRKMQTTSTRWAVLWVVGKFILQERKPGKIEKRIKSLQRHKKAQRKKTVKAATYVLPTAATTTTNDTEATSDADSTGGESEEGSPKAPKARKDVSPNENPRRKSTKTKPSRKADDHKPRAVGDGAKGKKHSKHKRLFRKLQQTAAEYNIEIEHSEKDLEKVDIEKLVSQVVEEAHRQVDAKRSARAPAFEDRNLKDMIEDIQRPNQQARLTVWKTIRFLLKGALIKQFSDFTHPNKSIAGMRQRAFEACGFKDEDPFNPAHPSAPLPDHEKEGDTNPRKAGLVMLTEEARVVKMKKHSRSNDEYGTTIQVPKVTDAMIKDVQAWNQTLTHPEYQPQNIKESMMALGMQSSSYKVMPRQNPAMRLKWWQILEINWAEQQTRKPGLRGGIIADMIGLGKSIEAGGMILHVSTHCFVHLGVCEDPSF